MYRSALVRGAGYLLRALVGDIECAADYILSPGRLP